MNPPSSTKELFIYWVTEREAMRARRAAGAPAPWTDDPAMAEWRYCNVYREDDRVTRWIRQHWTYPYTPTGRPSARYYTLAMMVARVFNLPRTLQLIGQPTQRGWLARARPVLLQAQSRGSRLWNGAYIVSTNGKRLPKIDRYMGIFGEAVEQLELIDRQPTLADTHHAITQVEGFGDFLAAQVVADLKNTPNHPLRLAEDWWTFSAPGPGSLRGLSRFWGCRVTPRTYDEAITNAWALVQPALSGRRLCRQDLQNCMCEFDKYMRVLAGGRAKQRYRCHDSD